MSNDIFDFGFTAVDENELPAVKDVNIKAEVYEAKGLDTQEICHPELTVNIGDLGKAKELVKKLENDKEFYKMCSESSRLNYNEHYNEEMFLEKWKK